MSPWANAFADCSSLGPAVSVGDLADVDQPEDVGGGTTTLKTVLHSLSLLF